MPSYTSEDIRNIALVGHAGSGKTTLAEALLLKAGVLGHAGQVEKGDTVSDFSPEEKEHGHSLFTSVMHCEVQGTHLNVIDTPGYPDFISHALAALQAVETVVVVINAAAGIESITRRLMERAEERNLCRMIVINRMDAENTDLPGLVAQIQEVFGARCLPINLPAEGGRKVLDCFFHTDGETDFGSLREAHTAILDQVVEVDEELMASYLEKGEVAPEMLHGAFEEALREGHLIPICFTAARRHDDPSSSTGVEELLEVFLKLAPNPLEGNPRPFLRTAGDKEEEFHATADPADHVLAHVFQVKIDPFVGKLSAFRIHQGTVRSNSQLYVGEARKPFRVGHLFKLQGGQHVEVQEAIPGDIVAVAKIEEIHRGSVLHDAPDSHHIHLHEIRFPQPMQGVAITARKRGDEQKISDALHKLQEEDPGIKVYRDSGTGETIIQAMGDLHMRVLLETLKNRYHVEVDTKPPKIAYRETITAKAEGHYRHKKQTGGAGQFGEVYLRVEPRERGAGFEFSDDTVGGSIPNQFIPAVEKGVRQALQQGAIAGYPIQDVHVSLYDGKHHPVDSKEVAFVTAGKRAFLEAMRNARPTLLEPTVQIEVTVPAAQMGDITGDLSGKRGRIQGTDIVGDMAVVRAQVPLSEVTNYQSQLKSVTGGQGSYSMEFSHYEPVPPHVQEQVAAQYKPKEEED